MPSIAPSNFPSKQPTQPPSVLPSKQPSYNPSNKPTHNPTFIPSIFPSHTPSTAPTTRPSPEIYSSRSYVGPVVGAVSGSVILLILGLCWKRCRGTDPNSNGTHPSPPRFPFQRNRNGSSEDQVQIIPPHESVNSIASFISSGMSVASDSGDEMDDTHNLVDEFDKYKNENLEKMRSEVSGTLSDMDEIMCRALAKALMDDMDENEMDDDMATLCSWGSMEIEASVLCDVNAWLKKKEEPSLDAR